MLLAVNIGNSRVNIAIFDGNKIIKSGSIPTQNHVDTKSYTDLFKTVTDDEKITECAIISVVNGLDTVIKDICDSITGINSKILKYNSVQAIRINTPNPECVGMDRLANIYAVSDYSLPAIVVDIGTAVTFDILSKERVFLGGIIMPGVNMSLRGLHEGTSKLPYIEPQESPYAIGNDTETCILSGVVRGTAAAIDGLLKQCIDELGDCETVILTGGQAELVSKHMTYPINDINQQLTMLGIKKMYNLSR